MSVPYEPVIYHAPTFGGAWICQSCSYGLPNTPCGHPQCGCACMKTILAQRDDPTRHVIPDPTDWHEPPAKPEPLDTWRIGDPPPPTQPPTITTNTANLTKKGESEEHTDSTVGDNLWTRLLRWLRGGPSA